MPTSHFLRVIRSFTRPTLGEMNDTLFLLTVGFHDGEGAPYYCPHCTIFEGLLSLFPALAAQIDVKRVEFARPRAELVELLGEENQSCPVLILGSSPSPYGDGLTIKEAKGRHFLDEAEDIGNYLSRKYGIPRPH